MAYKQLVKPDLTIVGKVGWCLQYARTMFHASAVEPSAWKAWMNAQYRHENRNHPTDVSMPLWFSYRTTIDGIYDNWGHVVNYVPGQGYYSSPYKTGTTHAVLSSIAEVEKLYGVTYVGWTEDVSKVRVIEGGTMETFNDGDRRNLNFWLYNEDRLKFGGAIGRPYKEAIGSIMTSNEYLVDAFVNDGDVGNINAATGRSDANKVLRKTWKVAGYDYFMKLAPPNYEEVTEKLYRKKG